MRAPVPFVSLSKTHVFAISFDSSPPAIALGYGAAAVSEQVVTLVIDRPGSAARAARERLVEQLADARVDEPDPESGVFDVILDSESRDEALNHVWNALAAAGSDDEILFLEHPDVPEHWRSRPA